MNKLHNTLQQGYKRMDNTQADYIRKGLFVWFPTAFPEYSLFLSRNIVDETIQFTVVKKSALPQKKLIQNHIAKGSIPLYDVLSSAMERVRNTICTALGYPPISELCNRQHNKVECTDTSNMTYICPNCGATHNGCKCEYCGTIFKMNL